MKLSGMAAASGFIDALTAKLGTRSSATGSSANGGYLMPSSLLKLASNTDAVKRVGHYEEPSEGVAVAWMPNG